MNRFLRSLTLMTAWYLLMFPAADLAWTRLEHYPMPLLWIGLPRLGLWIFWCAREFPGYRWIVGARPERTTDAVVPEVPSAPLVGWRAWSIAMSMQWADKAWVSEPALMGVALSQSWPSDEPAQAMCFGGRGHRAPDPDCQCGIYAVADWRHARLISRIGRRQVYGPVLTWGRTQVHERGWRSEFAQPLALVRSRILRPKLRWETNLLLDKLGARYAVPVLSLKEAKALAGRMAEKTL